jgi:hypothetical protein
LVVVVVNRIFLFGNLFLLLSKAQNIKGYKYDDNQVKHDSYNLEEQVGHIFNNRQNREEKEGETLPMKIYILQVFDVIEAIRPVVFNSLNFN